MKFPVHSVSGLFQFLRLFVLIVFLLTRALVSDIVEFVKSSAYLGV